MKNLRDLLKGDLSKIEQNLTTLFSNENQVLADLNSFINGSSKKIRSILCLIYLKANNVEINKDVINVLSSGELIHNASLLHDDVIDDSEMRRENVALHKKYNSKISILGGDYLLSLAVKNLLEIDNKVILTDLIETAEKMSLAEIEQYLNRGQNTDKEKYLNVISGKTASLFKVLLKSCAKLAGIDYEKAGKFGHIFGILFQINNDLSPNSQENDKLNKLKTITDILGIEKTKILQDNYREELREMLSGFPENEYKVELENLVNKL